MLYTNVSQRDRKSYSRLVGYSLLVAGSVALAACSREATEVATMPAAADVPWVELGIPDGQWPTYGGGPYNQNYSPLTQINKDNVANLQVAWTFNYGTGQHEMGDAGLDYRFEVTPLLIGGVMYLSTPSHPQAEGVPATITALIPETGEVLWRYESPRNIHGRGIAYWPGDAETAPRIIFATDGGYIMAVNATTGELATDFGLQGVVDAYVGVVSEIVGDSRRSTFTIPNPVTIYKDMIITGARPGEAGPPGPRGDIRAFSTRTGRLQWTFHVLPGPGEANPSELAPVNVPDLTGGNVWSTMTLDPDHGILYATTGDVNGRGVDVAGPEPFANSLVALNADTGELLWYRKMVFKDNWDWDSPTPTVLMDLEHEGETVPAILYTGKQSLVFLFNRLTGESLNGYELREAEAPDESYWPVQPWPSAPGPLSVTGMSREDIADLVPGQKEACEQQWDQLNPVNRGIYGAPVSGRPSIRVPGSTGGPNWGGGSYDPESRYFYLNMQQRISIGGGGGGGGGFGATAPSFTFTTPDGVTLSCVGIPSGALVALNLNNLEIAWKVPLGVDPELGELGLQAGAPNLGGNIVTAGGLVFIGATNERHFRAFDADNGALLWDTVLPASGNSTPITYMGADGNQYVVIAAGGGTSVGRAAAEPLMSDSLVAFKLP